MTFATDKQRYLEALGKPDKSKKGGVDEYAWPLIDAINARDEFYTTSSCSGRTSLFAEGTRKDDHDWHFVTHDLTSCDEVKPFLEKLPDKPVWFKFEGVIFHVVARDADTANSFLRFAKEAGFKHSGLLGIEKRFIIELVDFERIDVPIAIEGKLLVSEEYVQFLIEKANEKLVVTHGRMGKLKKLLSSLK